MIVRIVTCALTVRQMCFLIPGAWCRPVMAVVILKTSEFTKAGRYGSEKYV